MKSIFGEDLATFQIPSCSNKNQHGICFKRLLKLHMASFQSKCNVHFLCKQERFETSCKPQTSISFCGQIYAIWYFESPLHTISKTEKGNKKGPEISVHIFKKILPFFVKAWTLKILRSSQSNFETHSKKSHRTLTKLDEQWLFSVARRRRKKGNRKSSTNSNSVQRFCGNFPKTLNSPLIANCYHTANGESFLLTLRCWTA